MPTGRPSRFTPEITEKILAHARKGRFATTAARAAGIGIRTLYSWLRRGKRREKAHEAYREFRHAYYTAEAEGRLLLERIATGEAVAGNLLTAKEALEILSRRWPMDWGSERWQRALEDRLYERLKSEGKSDEA